MDNTKLIQEAMDKIASENQAQLETFITAILRVRQDIGEDIDMNHIALEYGRYRDKDYNFISTMKVVYLKGN